MVAYDFLTHGEPKSQKTLIHLSLLFIYLFYQKFIKLAPDKRKVWKEEQFQKYW